METSQTFSPGRYYRRMWIVPATVLIIIGVMLPLLIVRPGSFASDADRIEIATFLVVLFLGALALPNYYRSSRTLRADDNGIALLHGNRVKRSLCWEEIRRIEYGPRELLFGFPMGNYRGFQLLIRGVGRRRYISFFDGFYGASPGALAKFADALGFVAQRRSIVVVKKSRGWGWV
jgi:hypothetical protein